MRAPRITAVVVAALAAALASPRGARAAERDGQLSGFACFGEAASVAAGLSLAELRDERDKRLADLDAGRVAPHREAHVSCVAAELMKRLGDGRAAEYYERAIAANPRDPAYELWYGRYLHWRGAASPLFQAAERHDLAALAKQDQFHGMNQVGATDEVLREWTMKDLALLYQEDGLPLLPYGAKAYPYRARAPALPQLGLIAVAGAANDTVDFWDAADTRKLTGEAQLAISRSATKSLPPPALAAIARAPLRWDAQARLRLRQPIVGALDVFYRRSEFLQAQITSYSEPLSRNDISLRETGAELRRTFDLYPLFDFTVDALASRQWRTGIIEGFPGLTERVNVVAVSPMFSRYIGPNKLTVVTSVAYLDIPDLTPGELPGISPPALDQRARLRLVRALGVDFATYRPLVLPQLQAGTWTGKRVLTRGWHFFAAAVLDDERFGSTIVSRDSLVAGTAFKGWQGLDLLLSETLNVLGNTDYGVPQPALENSQLRTTLRVLARLVDEDATPGVPSGAISAASLAFPARVELARTGPRTYESVRAGAELWLKLLSTSLRGTSFLIDAGIEAQYFFHLDKVLPVAHVDLRMGWPGLGNLPAYF